MHQLQAQVRGHAVRVVDPETGREVLLESWSEMYRPLLEVFATTFDDLGIDELMALTPTLARSTDLNAALDRLAHLLDHNRGRYRFHHGAIAEFLTARETARDPATAGLAVDATAAHTRIASNLAGVLAITEPDAAHMASTALRYYALAFLPAHLVAALSAAPGDSAEPARLRRELRRLLTDPAFIESKVSKVGIQAMLTDFAAADPLLGAGGDVASRMYYLLAAEADNLESDQRGDEQPLGRRYFGTWQGDFGRLERFHAPWLVRPGFVVQQLLNRAVSAGDSELARVMRAELERRSIPRLELEWATSTSLPQIFDSGLGESRAPERIVAASPDGRRVLTHPISTPEGEQPVLTVWDTETGARATVSTTEAEVGASWAVTADGGTAASSTREGIVTVWDLREGKREGALVQSGLQTTALTMADSGAWVVAGGKRGELRVWDLVTRDSALWPLDRSTTTPLDSAVACVAVLGGDRGVVCATDAGSVHVWDLDGPVRLVHASDGVDQPVVGCITTSRTASWPRMGTE